MVLGLLMAAMWMQSGDGSDMMVVRKVCPGIRIELRYGTPRNGVGRTVYPRGARCMLRRAVAERLCRVQTALEAQGLGLKIWDAYRPLSAQKALWAIKPDKRFVALPSVGSKHNRGAAVDLTLVDTKGKEKPMPCDFDTFSPRASPKYSGGTAEQRRNRDILRRAMLEAGFLPDKNEWWHFNDPEWKKYPLVNVPLVVSGRDKSE